jgi:hypothetical protein
LGLEKMYRGWRLFSKYFKNNEELIAKKNKMRIAF